MNGVVNLGTRSRGPLNIPNRSHASLMQRKAKEFQLQAFLRLLITALASPEIGPVDPIPEETLEEIVQLLGVVAFASSHMEMGGFQVRLHSPLSIPPLPKRVSASNACVSNCLPSFVVASATIHVIQRDDLREMLCANALPLLSVCPFVDCQ